MIKSFTARESVKCCSIRCLLEGDAVCVRRVQFLPRTNGLNRIGKYLISTVCQMVKVSLLWVCVFVLSCVTPYAVAQDYTATTRQLLANVEPKTSPYGRDQSDDQSARVLFKGLLESSTPQTTNVSDVVVDENAEVILNATSQQIPADPSASDTLAKILGARKASPGAMLVRNTPQFGLEQNSIPDQMPPVGKKPVSLERRTLPGKSVAVRQTATQPSDLGLISQAPLIDEPLGSGLATPIVSRGGALPPPVILERLPPPSQSRDVFEILPEPPTDSAATAELNPPLDSEIILEGEGTLWIDSASPAQPHTRRHRFLRKLGKRMEPLRPINLCDRGLYFATEFTFLSSSRIAKSQVEVADMLTDVEHCIESEGAFGYGQRGILGVQGEVFGFEMIYWDYGSRGYESGSWKPPYLFEQYTTGQSVDLSTLDLEITQRFCVAGVNLGTAVGLRKMDYVGHSSAFSLASYHDEQVEVSSSALAKNRLEGIGPTFAIRGSRPIFSLCDIGTYGAGLFWDTRVSWLWSDASSSAITEATAVSTTTQSPTVSRSLDYAYTVSDDPELRMHAGLQLGFQCWRSVGCRSRLISRAAFEYQYFEQSDDYSMATSYAFLTDSVNFGGASSALAENTGQNLNMFGFTLLVGINY